MNRVGEGQGELSLRSHQDAARPDDDVEAPIENADAPADRPVTAVDRLHFVLEVRAPSIRARTTSPVVSFAFAFAALLVLDQLGRYLGKGRLMPWLCFGISVAFLGALIRRWFIRDRTSLRGVPLSSDRELRDARLIARGNRVVLSALAELTHEAFEPVIIEVHSSKVRTWTLFPVAFVLVFVTSMFIPWKTSMAGGLAFPTVVLIYWLIGRCRPTYYRISPGRMDIMVGSFVGGRVRLPRRIDLRSASIVLLSKERCLLIRQPDEPPVEIPYEQMSEPMPFVSSVFSGALCTSPAPPLPDDALLG